MEAVKGLMASLGSWTGRIYSRPERGLCIWGLEKVRGKYVPQRTLYSSASMW